MCRLNKKLILVICNSIPLPLTLIKALNLDSPDPAVFHPATLPGSPGPGNYKYTQRTVWAPPAPCSGTHTSLSSPSWQTNPDYPSPISYPTRPSAQT